MSLKIIKSINGLLLFIVFLIWWVICLMLMNFCVSCSYSHRPHNGTLVCDEPHIWQWSCEIITELQCPSPGDVAIIATLLHHALLAPPRWRGCKQTYSVPFLQHCACGLVFSFLLSTSLISLRLALFIHLLLKCHLRSCSTPSVGHNQIQ